MRPKKASIEALRKLSDGMHRARKLHPWRNIEAQVIALRFELMELEQEIPAGDRKRIEAEALDCAIVAMRIVEGS